MTVHRYIHAALKHQAKTACGILLFAYGNDCISLADDGAEIDISHKGKPFDCKRCRTVLELRHQRVDR
ncbi:hypothetical protein ACRQ5Q_15285 [Bradyrhizobium sp. PMVTL-01]|uniref:hypothetical protein n=1 Tax=Bradyrhizobium sp. PMVTL-01 TaxID=3434999 RepID=UPI003F718D60